MIKSDLRDADKEKLVLVKDGRATLMRIDRRTRRCGAILSGEAELILMNKFDLSTSFNDNYDKNQKRNEVV